MKLGGYFKLVGGHDGAAWIGRRWERFDCETCARAEGIAKERLQGPMTEGAADAMRGPVLHRHDAAMHEAHVRRSRTHR